MTMMNSMGSHENQNYNNNMEQPMKQVNREYFNKGAEESQISSKINHYKLSIRNRQIHQYKNRIRQKMLSIDLLEEMVENMPTDSKSTYSWAFQLSQIYSQAAKYMLTPHKVVELFRLVQKFPNQLTLQLLEIIIYKSDVETIDLMFQYDVIKLLHSFINFSSHIPHKRFNRVENHEEGDDILQEIVVINDAVKKVAENSNLYEFDQNYQQKVEIARTVLRVIGQLCRKQSHIRNFAILNHKSYTYCLKSYKHFHKDIQIEFIAFLQSITSHPFTRNDEQFDRVVSKIFNFFFNQKIQLKIQILHQKTSRNYLVSYEHLIIAMTNLLKMKDSWIIQKIFSYFHEKSQLKIINIILNLIKQCNYVFAYPTIDQLKEDLLPNKLFKHIVELIMPVVDALDRMEIVIPQKDYIHFELIQFLRKGKVILGSQHLSVARRGIYFILSNYFYNQLSQNLIHQLLIFDDNDHQNNLLSLIANLLQIQYQHINRLQIYQLTFSIFYNIPISMIEPLLISSQIIAIIIEKLLQQTYISRKADVQQTLQKGWLIKIVHIFFTKLQEQEQDKFVKYRDMMLGMYKDKLEQMALSQWINDSLSDDISSFLGYLRFGTACN